MIINSAKEVMVLLNNRQTELLKLIVEEYIRTAHPIGSKSLCETLNCSSATIRNEMSNLEDLGLLEKTHTSSGRIPSEEGYRLYVGQEYRGQILHYGGVHQTRVRATNRQRW